MDEEIEQDNPDIETIHIQSKDCNCTSCLEKRNKYIQILDVDRYIESLNDWD